MIRKQLYTLCLMLTFTAHATTDGGIVFDRLKHDFGRFSEDGDNQTCTFRFTNRSGETVSIAQVQSTCGCAVARYTREAIHPGKTGTVSVTYNPKGRPGHFNRSVVVKMSGSEKSIRLTISGEVVRGAPRKHGAYPYVIGELQLKTDFIRFGPMRAQEQEQSVVVINSGTKPLQVEFHSADARFLASTNLPLLMPDESGEIRIIRKGGTDKASPRCIRLKERKGASRSDGTLQLELVQEKCDK